MTPNLFTSITLAVAILFSYNSVSGQKKTVHNNKTNMPIKEIKNISMENYESFKASVKPLIEKMGVSKIVGLGEGTHGTSEFYKIRFWISRLLVEEKGFRNIAFENDLGDTWYLNQQLNTTADLNTLMQNHLMSIWQNEETKELLTYVKNYNSTHTERIVISGIDYPFLKPDVEMLMALFIKAKDTTLLPAAKSLLKAASLQDEAWIGINNKAYKADMPTVSAGSKKGHITADSLEQEVKKLNFPPALKTDLLLVLANLKQGFAPFYKKANEVDRDSIMAHNVSLILKKPNDKIIIWAHNAHLGKTKIYNNAVGGTGGHLLKLFPNNYFALGTGTATGKFSGTKDRRPTKNNPMEAYSLEIPIKDSWEELWSSNGSPAFYFNTAQFNPEKEIKPLRFVGFGPKSGASSFDKSNLIDMFDVFLFLKDTNAATPLR